MSTSPAEYVADLKRQPGGDIGIHGSISLASSLLRAGLVDVLELAVAPAVAGQGRRVFDGDDTKQSLQLTDMSRSPAGTLFLTYRRASHLTPSRRRSLPAAPEAVVSQVVSVRFGRMTQNSLPSGSASTVHVSSPR